MRDPELRAKLTPNYQPMCKRQIMAGHFYRSVQKPGVEVITDPIDHIEPRGIVTADGALHELDLLVYATGFDARAYVRPLEMIGEGGLSLDEAWADGPMAYQSVAVPGFPNMFMLMGPHSPIDNQGIQREHESRYAADDLGHGLQQLVSRQGRFAGAFSLDTGDSPTAATPTRACPLRGAQRLMVVGTRVSGRPRPAGIRLALVHFDVARENAPGTQ